MTPLFQLAVILVIIAIVIWGVNQVKLPEPFNYVKIVVYCVLAIWLVLKAAALFGIPVLG